MLTWTTILTAFLAVSILMFLSFSPLLRSSRRRLGLQLHLFRVSWVDRYEQLTKNARCEPLRREILRLVRDRETAERLLNSVRLNNPGKSERWYLEKVIYDLKRGR